MWRRQLIHGSPSALLSYSNLCPKNKIYMALRNHHRRGKVDDAQRLQGPV